jgi:hypothetical protein
MAEYQQYFAWKNSKLSKSFEEKLSYCIFNNAECRLANAASNLKVFIEKKRKKI